ncbi:unnamed protein product, partial [Laminaria digitata]
RGFEVYKGVCAGCHGLRLVAYRNLMDIGFTEDEVKAIAAEVDVPAEPNADGEIEDRPGIPADRFKSPFANENAARAANNGAYPPDLSLMAKARKNGSNYLYALMGLGYEDSVPEEVLKEVFQIVTTSREKAYKLAVEAYEDAVDAGKTVQKPEEPALVSSIEDLNIGEGLYFNAYFPGFAIAMAPPLYDEGIEYADKTEATVKQQAEDVAMFLTWAAEPKLEDRKNLGIKVILFLLLMTGLLYVVKRRIWADVH